MPKVTFVNEHRIVEVEKGRLVSEIARDLGIAFRRETFFRTGIGDATVWIKGGADCVSPPGFMERLKGARGWRRFADRTRVLGDCEIAWPAGLLPDAALGEVVEVGVDGWRDACSSLPLLHMGRGPADDPWFFASAFAAGRHARALLG